MTCSQPQPVFFFSWAQRVAAHALTYLTFATASFGRNTRTGESSVHSEPSPKAPQLSSPCTRHLLTRSRPVKPLFSLWRSLHLSHTYYFGSSATDNPRKPCSPAIKMLIVPSPTTYAVHPTYPPLSLLAYKPSANPQAVYPPPADGTLARPFNVSPEVYNNLLHAVWPITIATVYAATVRYINQINTQRENKPWTFSKTIPFYFLVVAHNVGLAIFSGWVFLGMFNAIKQSWPGWNGQYSLAGAADALCKINGPRGLGSAATYNMSTERWGFTDRAMKLAGLEPDSADLGRIWNEGLAYYGFFFYLSKFYEVVDTAIVLAKGKNSSFLQTYHHAGVMMCLWAGIRYMSPPIWMFTFINSGLHTLMVCIRLSPPNIWPADLA